MLRTSGTLVKIILSCCLSIALLACGGGEIDGLVVNLDDTAAESNSLLESTPDGATAVAFSVAADTGFSSLAPLTKDASAGVRITGDGERIFRINDQAAADCNFTFGELSVDGNVQIVNSNDPDQSCNSANNCLVCTASQTRGACGLSCEGYIPSTSAVAADGISVRWTMRNDFFTDMPNVRDGAIRIDAHVVDWEEMSPIGQNTTISHNLSRCDGNGGRMTASDLDVLNVSTQTATHYRRSFAMLNKGDGHCQVGTMMDTIIPFENIDIAANHDPNVSNTSIIYANGKICDDGSSDTTCGSDLFSDQESETESQTNLFLLP